MKKSKFDNYVRSNKDYYNVMERHGYLLPSLSCAMVSREYLDGIRLGQYYCPHKRDKIPKLVIANPPPKKELLRLWKKGCYDKCVEEPDKADKWNSILSTLELIEEEGKLPDSAWLTIALADCPGTECEVFQKSYRYIKQQSEIQKPEILFYNDDGLFDDELPGLDSKHIRKKNAFRVPKKYRLQAEKEYLAKKKLMLIDQMRKVDNELSDAEQGITRPKKYMIPISDDEAYHN